MRFGRIIARVYVWVTRGLEARYLAHWWSRLPIQGYLHAIVDTALVRVAK